jgi:hypothetical protein
VWPATNWPETYEKEVDIFREWLLERLDWMDSEWYNMGDCSDLSVDADDVWFNKTEKVTVYPNPSNFDRLYFKIQTNENLDDIFIEIYDLQGRIVYNKRESTVNTGKFVFQAANLQYLTPGMYLYKVFNSKKMLGQGKLNKNE